MIKLSAKLKTQAKIYTVINFYGLLVFKFHNIRGEEKVRANLQKQFVLVL